jgi:hypothetical protein
MVPPAIASPLLLCLFASESFPLRHDQILVGLRAPGVEVLVRVVAHAFLRNLDFFGLDVSERLVLHLLDRTVGAVAIADRSAAVNFREFSFFADFNFLSLSTSLSPLLESAVLATSFPPSAFNFFAGGGFEVDLLRLAFLSFYKKKTKKIKVDGHTSRSLLQNEIESDLKERRVQ